MEADSADLAAINCRARHLLLKGQIEDSLAATRSGLATDHESPFIALDEAEILYQARRFDEAVGHIKTSITKHPFGIESTGLTSFRFLLGRCYEQLGRFDEALRVLKKSKHPHGCWNDWRGNLSTLIDAAIGIAHIRDGHPEKGREILAALFKRRDELHMSGAIAVLLLHLGEIDEGFVWLNRAVDQYDRLLLTIKTHPWFDIVRDDSRFADILKRMNLADWLHRASSSRSLPRSSADWVGRNWTIMKAAGAVEGFNP